MFYHHLHKNNHITIFTWFFNLEYDKDKSKYNINCQNEITENYDKEKPCFFDINDLGECSKPPYGYAKPLQPCVLIKFNKVISKCNIVINEIST